MADQESPDPLRALSVLQSGSPYHVRLLGQSGTGRYLPLCIECAGLNKEIWVRGKRTASKHRVSLRVDETAELVRNRFGKERGQSCWGGPSNHEGRERFRVEGRRSLSHSFSAGFPTNFWKWVTQYSVAALMVRRLQPLTAHIGPRYRLTPGSIFFSRFDFGRSAITTSRLLRLAFSRAANTCRAWTSRWSSSHIDHRWTHRRAMRPVLY